MIYMGSKNKIAKYIVPIIQSAINKSGYTTYIEPFFGGANVIDKITAKYRIGYDINPYLIALFNYVVKDNGNLPNEISRQEYYAVKSYPKDYEAWFVGCVGFLASYRRKFFGGYAGEHHDKKRKRNPYDEAKKNLLKQCPNLKNIDFITSNYRCLRPSKCVIYCDPPYENTTKYNKTDRFNHYEFWELMRQWSRTNIVFISEENAPSDFKCIWEHQVHRTLNNNKKCAIEKLFVHETVFNLWKLGEIDD